jgi:5-formyltetrahydrofolate cyclo-ligase
LSLIVPFLDKLQQQGRLVLLPRVEGDGNLVPVPLYNWDDMQVSSLGIREPRGNPCKPETIDAVLVPGLVFDVQGYRLGYGRGFYDHFCQAARGLYICHVMTFRRDNIFP